MLIQQIKVSKLISLVKNISLYNFVLILERADQEAKNQFLEEIELMKAIGCHKNVVIMLGCCVTSGPMFFFGTGIMLRMVIYNIGSEIRDCMYGSYDSGEFDLL